MKAMQRLYDSISSSQKSLADALSQEERAVYRLTETECIRGISAERLQAYLADGILKILAEADLLAEELLDEVHRTFAGWFGFESSSAGTVSQEILALTGQQVREKRMLFAQLSAEVQALLKEAASAGLAFTVRTGEADAAYESLESFLSGKYEEMEKTDASYTAEPEELLLRIRALGRQAEKVGCRCRKDGVLLKGAAEEAREITADYSTGKKFDPADFVMYADRRALFEGQAAAGLFSDVYAAAEYTAAGAEYESSAESSFMKALAYLKAEAEMVDGEASARLTKYLQAYAFYRNSYASADMKAIISPADTGIRIDSEIDGRRASAKVKTGAGALNFSAYAEAGLFSASEKAGSEYKTNFQYGNGFDAQASLCYASAGIGADFLKLKIKDGSGNTVSTDSLFSLKAKAKAKIGVEAKAWQDCTTAWEGKNYVINVVTCSISLVFLGGVDISASMPLILPKIQNKDGSLRYVNGEY